MSSRTSPPRPSDHSRSCPAYSPLAKYSSCTCGLTTPRKSKRPTLDEATAAALAVDAKAIEATRKAEEERATMESAIMGTGTAEQQRAKRETQATGVETEQPDLIAGVDVPSSATHHGAPPLGTRIGSGYPGGGVDRAARTRGASPVGAAAVHASVRLLSSSEDLATLLGTVERQVSNTFDRLVTVNASRPDGYASLEIVQRCAACREHVEALIENTARFGHPLEAETVRVFSEVGGAARRAYVKHRCAQVDRDPQLSGMSRAELETLAQELERDGTAMVKRSIELEQLAKERADG